MKKNIFHCIVSVLLVMSNSLGVSAQWTCADVNLTIDAPQNLPYPDDYLNFDFFSADFDGDGFKDLLGEANINGEIGPEIFLNTSVALGPITFNSTPSLIYSHSNATLFNYPAITVADFNSDGKPDVAEQVYDSILVYKNNSTSGNISFSVAARFHIGYPVNISYVGFTYAVKLLMGEDMDGDSNPDIELDDVHGHISIFRNTTPSGSSVCTFAPAFVLPYPSSFTFGMAINDFTGDGLPDICAHSSDTLYNFANTTVGTNLSFSYSGHYELNTVNLSPWNNDQSLNFDYADADLDGKTDLLLHVNYSNDPDSSFVCILHNGSTSSQVLWDYKYRFGYPFHTPLIMSAVFLKVCESVPDVVVALDGIQSGGSQAFWYFKNTSTAGVISFNLNPCIVLNIESDMLCVDDFNNDSKADFCSWWDLHQIAKVRNLSLFASSVGSINNIAPSIQTSGCLQEISFNYSTSCFAETLHFDWSPSIAGDTSVAWLDPINDSVTVHVYTDSLTYDSTFTFLYNPPSPNVAANVITTLCQRTITLTPSSNCDSSVFHYVWSPSFAGDTNVAVISGYSGLVTVHAYNDSLTFDSTFHFQITLPQMNVTPTNDTICAGQSTQIFASGDQQYSWSPSSGLSSTSNSSVTASPTLTTTYTVMGSCNDSAIVVIHVNPNPVTSAGPDTTICFGQQVQLIAGGGNTYQWQPVSGLSNSGISNPIATPTVSTTYTVLITNQFGCSNTESVVIFVTYIPQIYAGHDTTILINSSYLISDASTDGFTYFWSPDSWINNISVVNPIVTPLITTTYILTSVSAEGCIVSDSVVIYVDQNLYLYFPSAFSPNGDGVNDIFHPVFYNVSDYHLKIFNRWGELIFETNDPAAGWDGKYKGEDQEVGVYVYYADAKGFSDGVFKSLQGNITLLR